MALKRLYRMHGRHRPPHYHLTPHHHRRLKPRSHPHVIRSSKPVSRSKPSDVWPSFLARALPRTEEELLRWVLSAYPCFKRRPRKMVDTMLRGRGWAKKGMSKKVTADVKRDEKLPLVNHVPEKEEQARVPRAVAAGGDVVKLAKAEEGEDEEIEVEDLGEGRIEKGMPSPPRTSSSPEISTGKQLRAMMQVEKEEEEEEEELGEEAEVEEEGEPDESATEPEDNFMEEADTFRYRRAHSLHSSIWPRMSPEGWARLLVDMFHTQKKQKTLREIFVYIRENYPACAASDWERDVVAALNGTRFRKMGRGRYWLSGNHVDVDADPCLEERRSEGEDSSATEEENWRELGPRRVAAKFRRHSIAGPPYYHPYYRRPPPSSPANDLAARHALRTPPLSAYRTTKPIDEEDMPMLGERAMAPIPEEGLTEKCEQEAVAALAMLFRKKAA
ncbi:uncharacterized protein VTP21DRAFT_9937 [Calcarisporiella thermophila]|uniref:uncharacterized protein n=1 Tax=Calcarisporiella thermophila TaxID=911321 RepID=UPI0037442F9A